MKIRTSFGDINVERGGDEVGFSPALVARIVLARSKCASAADASELLRELAGIEVSPEEVESIVRQVKRNASQ